ncbi:lysozyme-like [Chrysoperla carnea]|uniref:lysozyme-like n=1 Tax=Chrysoperla carnea TaxID=189513 RepID=UPI001D05E3C9|nr:lysozyme-like [Chrysoperla carnea]
MNKNIIVLFISALSILQVIAETIDKCTLAQNLLDAGVSRNLLDDWVCVAGSESSYRTHIVTGPNKNKSYDYGLFQINSKWWCKRDGATSHNGCNVNCDDLLNNVPKSIECALKVYNSSKNKFAAWYGWRNKCKPPNDSMKNDISQYLKTKCGL